MATFFDSCIRSFLDKNVLLLMDNASCDGTADTISNLQYVQIALLVPDMTSSSQPLNMELLAVLREELER